MNGGARDKMQSVFATSSCSRTRISSATIGGAPSHKVKLKLLGVRYMGAFVM
jgi:hypothetical protein